MKLTEKINMKRYWNYYHVTPEKNFPTLPYCPYIKHYFCLYRNEFPLTRTPPTVSCRCVGGSRDESLMVWVRAMGKSPKEDLVFRWPYTEIGGLFWCDPHLTSEWEYAFGRSLEPGHFGFVLYLSIWSRGWLVNFWLLANPPAETAGCLSGDGLPEKPPLSNSTWWQGADYLGKVIPRQRIS